MAFIWDESAYDVKVRGAARNFWTSQVGEGWWFNVQLDEYHAGWADDSYGAVRGP